jgi:translation initiation factor 1 (eIF-1/SUI1)
VALQRSEGKCLTTVAFVDDISLPTLCMAFKKKLNCSVATKTNPKFGEVVLLGGDQRTRVKHFLVDQKICTARNVVVFEKSTRRGVVARCVLTKYRKKILCEWCNK